MKICHAWDIYSDTTKHSLQFITQKLNKPIVKTICFTTDVKKYLKDTSNIVNTPESVKVNHLYSCGTQQVDRSVVMTVYIVGCAQNCSQTNWVFADSR